MPPKVDKAIVSNGKALLAKYGSAGATLVRNTVATLVKADAARGMTTRYVALDDATDMDPLGAPVVTDAGDVRQNKEAIDAVFRALEPDYLMILGATDIVPHQDLENPLHDGDDPDQFAFGDLPYACEHPYSREISDFKGPTRVVGRLPDMTGSGDVRYLEGLLVGAADARGRDRSSYDDYHAASAEVWRASTRLSLKNLFGTSAALDLVPPGGSAWPGSKLAKLVHFYNCHGAQATPEYYGESKAGDFPVALTSNELVGQVEEGTVVAAECCYGGELYQPSAGRAPPICNRYLQDGAYGVFASTTIAYGPASGNGQADLITQYFLASVLNGASLGRAALEARQRFVRTSSPMDPTDLKTLAQFNLYGDPSITPVAKPSPKTPSFEAAGAESGRLERNDRRMLLALQGDHLAETEPALVRSASPVSSGLQQELRERAPGLEGKVLRFEVRYPSREGTLAKTMKSRRSESTAFVVGFERRRRAEDKDKRDIQALKLVVGREVDGKLVSVSTVFSR